MSICGERATWVCTLSTLPSLGRRTLYSNPPRRFAIQSEQANVKELWVEVCLDSTCFTSLVVTPFPFCKSESPKPPSFEVPGSLPPLLSPPLLTLHYNSFQLPSPPSLSASLPPPPHISPSSHLNLHGRQEDCRELSSLFPLRPTLSPVVVVVVDRWLAGQLAPTSRN